MENNENQNNSVEEQKIKEFFEKLKKKYNNVETDKVYGYHPTVAINTVQTLGNAKIGEYNIDINNNHAITSLIMYFMGDKKFEQQNTNFSLKKGIALIGKRGSGKTLLFNIFKDFNKELTENNEHHKVEVSEIVSNYKKYGDSEVALLKKAINENGTKNTIYLDNFCIEKILNPKDDSTVMAELMLKRYEAFTDHNVKTHLSTNVPDLETIKRFYGEDVYSRMQEMYNFISLKGESRRPSVK